MTKINAAGFIPTEHAVKRLNQRFNVPKSDAHRWVRRFMLDATAIDDPTSNNPKVRLFRREQCIAVVNLTQKRVITVYQLTPVNKVSDWGQRLIPYLQPYGKRICRHYQRDLVVDLCRSFIGLVWGAIDYQFMHHDEDVLMALSERAGRLRDTLAMGAADLQMFRQLFRTK
ncbi:hypothetical protein ACI3E1_02495 [Ligilactobacillus sp. LYQ139]|uniref:hypothetical protein n=1 Tax=Ligilactobacillus sp. LYQ139 TaxID=3378800 RepID=UPI0038545C77